MNEYHFITRWRVEGTVAEVYDIIEDVDSLTKWWPAVYLEAKVINPGDQHGVGKTVDLYTKGWLPYTLRWQLLVTAAHRPYSSTIEATGDLIGRGAWTFEQDGAMVKVTYDWQVVADKPLLRVLAFLLKPIFSANHRWAMAKGEESLRLELVRRRARNPEEVARVPLPPGPTFIHRRQKAR
jgi:hypothetical protein